MRAFTGLSLTKRSSLEYSTGLVALLSCEPELPRLPRPSLSRRTAELEKPVRLLRETISADPPRRGPRRCSEGGAWQAAQGGSRPQAERRARQTSPNAGGDQSGKVLRVPLPATFRGGAGDKPPPHLLGFRKLLPEGDVCGPGAPALIQGVVPRLGQRGGFPNITRPLGQVSHHAWPHLQGSSAPG